MAEPRMANDETLNVFLDEHGLRAKSVAPYERDGILNAIACHAAVQRDYAALPGPTLEADPAVGVLWQLYERCFERVEGALVAMVGAAAAASEIISRAAIEASATFQFLLLAPREHLAAFFANHLRETERQIRQWKVAALHLPSAAQALHLEACEYRGRASNVLGQLVAQINSELLGPQNPPDWPNIVGRFDAIGDQVGYRTFYARLCSEPHLDAEETLRFIFGRVSGQDVFERMAAETIAFSRLALAEAVRRYATAGLSFAKAYQLREATTVCVQAERSMSACVCALSTHVGADWTSG